MVRQWSTTPDPSLSKEGNYAAVSSAFCALSPRVLCFHRHSRFVPSVLKSPRFRAADPKGGGPRYRPFPRPAADFCAFSTPVLCFHRDLRFVPSVLKSLRFRAADPKGGGPRYWPFPRPTADFCAFSTPVLCFHRHLRFVPSVLQRRPLN